MALLTTSFAKALQPGLETRFRKAYGRQLSDPPPDFYDIPLETIKNLWIAKYGSSGLATASLKHEDDDFWYWVVTRITQEERSAKIETDYSAPSREHLISWK